MVQLILTLLILIVVAIILSWIPSKYFQPRDYPLELVEAWAEKSEYKLICVERKYFVSEPSFWIVPRGIVIYYVELIDRMGHERKGHVRFRSKWYGKLDPTTLRVRWL